MEWGVLFRDDKEGQPRFASEQWVERLVAVNRTSPMRLAGHLCAKAVRDLLAGDDGFVRKLKTWGFQRVQLNATAANNFDPSTVTPDTAAILYRIAESLPDMEFIVQRNEETRGIWEHLLNMQPLPNISYLFDESKGMGTVAGSYPAPPPEGVRFGYTGGLGPANLSNQLKKMAEAAGGRELWCDMESSMRSKYADGTEFFDVYKAMACIDQVCFSGARHSSLPCCVLRELQPGRVKQTIAIAASLLACSSASPADMERPNLPLPAHGIRR